MTDNYAFTTYQGQGASEIVPALTYFDPASTLVASFDSHRPGVSAQSAGSVVWANGSLVLTLSPTEVNNIKDCTFTITATNGGTVVTVGQGRISYVPSTTSVEKQVIIDISSTVDELVYPNTWAHRGGQNLFPENTLESVEGGISMGSPVVDLDCQLTADGVPIAMHDNTLDRTTSLTGNVSDFTLPALRRAAYVDSSSWLAGGWPDQNIPTIGECFQRTGLRAVVHTEAKQTNSMPSLINLVKGTGRLRNYFLASFDLNTAGSAAAAGIPSVYYMSTGLEATPAQIAAKGVTMVGVDYTAGAFTSSWVASMKAVGLLTCCYVVQRQTDSDAAFAKGVDVVWSNDPAYTHGTRNGYAYLRSSINLNTWDMGMYSPNGTPGIFSGGGYGWNDVTNQGARVTTLGALSPAKGNPNANTFTLTYTFDWTSAADTGRWVGGYFCMTTDHALRDNAVTDVGANGYRWLLTPTGALQLSKYTDGLNATTFASASTPALSLPQTNIGVKVTVTPTSITLARTDTTGSVTDTSANATAYRGGYHQIAMNGSTARFKTITVS